MALIGAYSFSSVVIPALPGVGGLFSNDVGTSATANLHLVNSASVHVDARTDAKGNLFRGWIFRVPQGHIPVGDEVSGKPSMGVWRIVSVSGVRL